MIKNRSILTPLNNKENYRIGLEAGISLLCQAGVPVFIKFTAANTYTIGLFRLSVAGLLMLILLNPVGKLRLPSRRLVFPLMLIGVVFSLHWISYFLGIKMATASIGVLGVSTYGIHLMILGWIFRGNKPSVTDLAGLAVALIGTWVVIPEFSLSNETTLGLLLAIASGFGFALLPVLHQRFQHIPDKTRTFGQFLFAWCVFLLFLPATDWDLQQADWWSLLYLALIGTLVSHWLWIRVTTRISTIITSLIFYLAIPMTMLISYFWLEEPMPFSKIAGALLIVGGNVLSIGGRLLK
jgi:drug/metabolite transporter (DMT)-like permease